MDSHPRLINPYTRYYADNLPEPTAWSIRHCTHPLRLLAQAKVILANAQAVQGRTELDVNRYTLWQEQAASQQDLDNAVQNNMAAKATVGTAQAQIKTAEAAVETAKIHLDFTRLIAPIDGIAGQATASGGCLDQSEQRTGDLRVHPRPYQGLFYREREEYLDWNKRFPTESKWKFRLEPAYEEDDVKPLKEGVKSKHFRPMFVAQALDPPVFGRFKSLQYFRPPFVYRNGWMSRRASPR